MPLTQITVLVIDTLPFLFVPTIRKMRTSELLYQSSHNQHHQHVLHVWRMGGTKPNGVWKYLGRALPLEHTYLRSTNHFHLRKGGGWAWQEGVGSASNLISKKIVTITTCAGGLGPSSHCLGRETDSTALLLGLGGVAVVASGLSAVAKHRGQACHPSGKSKNRMGRPQSYSPNSLTHFKGYYGRQKSGHALHTSPCHSVQHKVLLWRVVTDVVMVQNHFTLKQKNCLWTWLDYLHPLNLVKRP